VCEPAAAGTGAVKATTVLYNSSPRGIYRYSSPNAVSSSHAYLPGGYSYSMGGGSCIPSSSSSSSSSIRRATSPAATAAAAAAAVTAMTSAPRAYHDLKPVNYSVQLMAKTLESYSQQEFAGTTTAAAAAAVGSAGFGSSCYRSPSTPGFTRGHISNGGYAASGFAAAAARGVSSGGFRASGAVGAQSSNSRVSNAGSACNVSSGGSMLTPALLQQQQQQMASAGAGVARSRPGSNAGSVVSMTYDRTYAEVVSTPRSVACGTPRSVAGSVSGSSRRGHGQLRAVSGKGQLAWQPLQRGGSGYLATQ
jgi:hypothetical protein